MTRTNLGIDSLRSFAAVVDSGSFTAASERVARTQSAISVQIKRLEQALGQRVLDRTSRSLSLTPSGEILLGYARRILELNDESMRRISEPAVSGNIRLGVTEYFVPTRLPQLLAAFAGAYPGVELEVSMGLSRDLRTALAAGRLDAAIVRLTPRDRVPRIWSEPQVWVASAGRRPTRGEVVPLALLSAPCVLREHALNCMQRLRRRYQVRFTGTSMASVRAAVSAGVGVSIVPLSSVATDMHILSGNREYPTAGRLYVGVLRGRQARGDIVTALERVIRSTLGNGGATN